MSDIRYSEKLNLKFRIHKEQNGLHRAIFEDNVNYRYHEMQKIKDCSIINLKNIHNIKKIFEGVII